MDPCCSITLLHPISSNLCISRRLFFSTWEQHTKRLSSQNRLIHGSPHHSHFNLSAVMNFSTGRKARVITERTRSRTQVAGMGVLHRVAGGLPWRWVRSSVIWKRLGIEPLLLSIERAQLRWFMHLVRMSPPTRQVFLTGRSPQEKAQDKVEKIKIKEIYWSQY